MENYPSGGFLKEWMDFGPRSRQALAKERSRGVVAYIAGTVMGASNLVNGRLAKCLLARKHITCSDARFDRIDPRFLTRQMGPEGTPWWGRRGVYPWNRTIDPDWKISTDVSKVTHTAVSGPMNESDLLGLRANTGIFVNHTGVRCVRHRLARPSGSPGLQGGTSLRRSRGLL